MKAHINQLLESQVIRESSSPYASPIVLVRKKDESLRMCVDYRPLNSKTRKDAFPLPRIEESLDALSGARWFSTIDLASGYNQVLVSEKDRPKTAFCTPFGLFEFNRMPFGLCNAPSTFQRLMQRMFCDQQGQSLLLYLDDIVVYSSSVEQHLQRLEMVLGRLQKEGLKAKLEKCAFFQQEVGYLGHVISSQGVATDPRKIEAVANWRCFPSFYRRFVSGFAKLASPLHQLVAKLTGTKSQKGSGSAFSAAWTPQCEESFEALKSRLVLAPVLAYADFAALKQEVLSQLHQEHGHQGIERTTELVRQRCYWPGMSSDIKQWVLGCQRCQVAKDSGHGSHSFMGHLLASRPNEILAIDFTLLEPSRNGYENVMVMTDVFSKFTVAIPTRDQRAPTVAQVLVSEWFYKFGVPSRLHL